MKVFSYDYEKRINVNCVLGIKANNNTFNIGLTDGDNYKENVVGRILKSGEYEILGGFADYDHGGDFVGASNPQGILSYMKSDVLEAIEEDLPLLKIGKLEAAIKKFCANKCPIDINQEAA